MVDGLCRCCLLYTSGQRHVGVLYGFDTSDRSNAVMSAIGLTAADAHKSENGINYFTSDALNNKLAAALAANATTVKNALEVAVKNGGVAMPETDAAGHTSASNMEQGLYLVVETRVPENVTSTCNPFFVSLPMTTVDGGEWIYDIVTYPKNQTGNPDLSKTVREAKNSTGKHNGSLTDIKDGYACLLYTSCRKRPLCPPRSPMSQRTFLPRQSTPRRAMWSRSLHRSRSLRLNPVHRQTGRRLSTRPTPTR